MFGDFYILAGTVNSNSIHGCQNGLALQEILVNNILDENKTLKKQMDELKKENSQLKRLNEQHQTKWNTIMAIVALRKGDAGTDLVADEAVPLFRCHPKSKQSNHR